MQNKTITQLAQGLRAKEFSSVELTQHFLNRIEKHADLNAYITVTAEQAFKAETLSY
jgi:aspartyl-tRNA(Asn)/glutamyl-tRNA(Gln) amidotransferase subunit A